jgi:hypothetical protein
LADSGNVSVAKDSEDSGDSALAVIAINGVLM